MTVTALYVGISTEQRDWSDVVDMPVRKRVAR